MSIRFIAILTACVGVALLSHPPSDETVLSHTGRELDIAIVGHGFLPVVDVESAEHRYTRDGNLEIDANGQLVVSIAKKMWTIDPPTLIPNDWERIAFDTNGEVQVFTDGLWSLQGQLQLARFSRTPAFADPLAANVATDESGPPLLANPSDELGFIQQGWRERKKTSMRQTAQSLLIAFLGSIVINALIARGNTHIQNKKEP